MTNLKKQINDYLKGQLRATLIGLVILIVIDGIKYIIDAIKRKSEYIEIDGEES